MSSEMLFFPLGHWTLTLSQMPFLIAQTIFDEKNEDRSLYFYKIFLIKTNQFIECRSLSTRYVNLRFRGREITKFL